MKINLEVTKYGYWFECAECESFVGGNSSAILEHPAFETRLFSGKPIKNKPIKCPHVGERVKNPFVNMETTPV
jgi:hypothetical protein